MICVLLLWSWQIPYLGSCPVLLSPNETTKPLGLKKRQRSSFSRKGTGGKWLQYYGELGDNLQPFTKKAPKPEKSLCFSRLPQLLLTGREKMRRHLNKMILSLSLSFVSCGDVRRGCKLQAAHSRMPKIRRRLFVIYSFSQDCTVLVKCWALWKPPMAGTTYE